MEIKVFYSMVAAFLIIGGVLMGGLWFLDAGTNKLSKNGATQQTENSTDFPGNTSAAIDATASSSVTETANTQKPSSKVGLKESNNIKMDPIDKDKLYSLINAYRRDNKLGTLKVHLLLERSAQLKIADMEQNKYWAHKDPKGRDSWYLFEQVGYQFEHAGENLAFGYTTPWQVFEQWQKSPEHNAQLLTPEYEHMGLAVDCETYTQPRHTCIVVLHLGKQLL